MDFRCATGLVFMISVFGMPSQAQAILFEENFDGGAPSNLWTDMSETGGPQYNYQSGSFNLTGFGSPLNARGNFVSTLPQERRGATTYRFETRVMVPSANDSFQVTFTTGGGVIWGVPQENWPSIRMARFRRMSDGQMGLGFGIGPIQFSPDTLVVPNTWLDVAVDITPTTITGYLNGTQLYSGMRNSGDSRIFGVGYEVPSSATNLHEHNLRIDYIRFVPEPTSAVALGGLAAAFLRSRKRKAKNRGC